MAYNDSIRYTKLKTEKYKDVTIKFAKYEHGNVWLVLFIAPDGSVYETQYNGYETKAALFRRLREAIDEAEVE